MQTLYLMMGYPGAGKTTTAKHIHTLTGAEHLWTAQFRRDWFGNPTYQPDETKMLYERLNDMTEYLLKKGKSVIYDTSFNYYKDRQHLRTIANKCKVRTIVIWVVTPKPVAKDRAVINAHEHNNRILGHMPHEKFEQLTDVLEKPRKSEKHVEIDGTKITKKYIKNILSQIDK